MPKHSPSLALALFALAAPAAAAAQSYSDLPPLTPMSEAERQALPPEYRTAPYPAQPGETVTIVDGVETITRTRLIEAAPQAATAPDAYRAGYAPAYTPPVYAPAVFEREQWIEECRRRTAGQDKDDTGLIIGGLLGAIAGGFIGYEIAGASDRVLGTVLGVGGGGLIGGLIGSLFDGEDDEDRYDCEAALDAYLSQYGTPAPRVASRTIPYAAPAYGYPAPDYGYGYGNGYGYAPPQQVVLVPVRSEVPQQVVVRETERYETYTVPGAVRTIPDPVPSPKMIKGE